MLQKEEKTQCQDQKKFLCIKKFDSRRSLEFQRALDFTLNIILPGLTEGWVARVEIAAQSMTRTPTSPSTSLFAFNFSTSSASIVLGCWEAKRTGEWTGKVQAGTTAASAILELSGRASSAQHRL